MSHKLIIVATLALMLLATLVSPAMAASSSTNGLTQVQTTTWSVPVYSLSGVVPGHFRLMCGGCGGSGGNCSC